MSCVKPCAPAGETAWGLPPDSTCTTAASRAASRRWRWAACSMSERNFSTRACVLPRDVSPDALVPAAELPPCVETADNGALCIPIARSRAIVPSSTPGLVLGLFRLRGFLQQETYQIAVLAERATERRTIKA